MKRINCSTILYFRSLLSSTTTTAAGVAAVSTDDDNSLENVLRGNLDQELLSEHDKRMLQLFALKVRSTEIRVNI